VTIVLVSHSMEEVERLCDRLVVIDGGRVIGADTPEGLISEVVGTTRIRLRATDALDEVALRALPGVRSVSCEGRWWVIGGDEELPSVLDRSGLPIDEAHRELATLEHAYLALTRSQTTVTPTPS
jgi:ABC-2 type transport system ATP-binding protein